MPSDFESGTRKTIDLSIKTEKMTAEVLQNAMQDFCAESVLSKPRKQKQREKSREVRR
jgi:hypothetical protein